MYNELRRQDGRERPLALLNVAIETMNHAKRVSFIQPATVIFGTVTLIKVRFLLF